MCRHRVKRVVYPVAKESVGAMEAACKQPRYQSYTSMTRRYIIRACISMTTEFSGSFTMTSGTSSFLGTHGDR